MLMVELDANEDGMLQEDELNESLRERLKEIDTDGDSVISADELFTHYMDSPSRPPAETSDETTEPEESEDSEPEADSVETVE